jgi:hypothetical protein
MSTATIGMSAALDQAIRQGFSDARVRIAPDAKLADILQALEAMGVQCSVEDGFLVMTQGATPMHTALALKTFASKPENARFFILEGSHPSTWSTSSKTKYIAEHGADAYAKLLHQPKEAGIGVMSLDLTRAQYLSLTRAEKQAFIAAYGAEGVGRVMARKAK